MKSHMTLKKVLLWLFALLLFLIIIGPFLVPVPEIGDIDNPRELSDPDSRFIEVNGIDIHYKESGEGEPVFILLHGFGASTFSWREVMQPLSDYGRVIAYDRVGFGLTERPLAGSWDGENPYSPQAAVSLLIGLMDELDIERAILVGNSAGGSVALDAALQFPERVQALVLVDAAVTSGGASQWLRPLLRTPQMRHLGPLIARRIMSDGDNLIEMAWHDPSQVTTDIIDGYRKPTRIRNWDRALWELTIASQSLYLVDRLGEISVPSLVITGDDDRIIPAHESVRLAEDLPQAELVIIPECGHVPQEECPESFLHALVNFIH